MWLNTHTEVESGKKADRPKLQEAIGHANLVGATLIVAKLDRLSRSVSFLATLMEVGFDAAIDAAIGVAHGPS